MSHKVSLCALLIKKLTSGESLNAAEKTHLSECDDCMREVVCRLDEIPEEGAISGGKANNGKKELVSPPSPQVVEALERGSRVFAREFGV